MKNEGDLISVTDRTGAQTYFLYDGLGSAANLTDASGTTTGAYSYDVFGAIRSESGSSAFGNEWRFTGEQRDRQGNRNFYYLRARYYDPATGRFLSQDPLPTGNLYAYVGNNPVNLIDPLGLCGFRSFGDAWDCVENRGEEVVEEVVEAIPRMSTVISWADVVPLSPLSWEFTAALFTQMTILLSECSPSEMISLSVLNAANLVIGVGGFYVTATVTATTLVGGVIVAAEVAVVEASIVAATNEGLAKCEASGGSVSVVRRGSSGRPSAPGKE